MLTAGAGAAKVVPGDAAGSQEKSALLRVARPALTLRSSESMSNAANIAQQQAARLEGYKAARNAAKSRLQTIVGRIACVLCASGIALGCNRANATRGM